MEKKVFYGTGFGSFERPTQGLGLDVLSLQLACMQKAKENNENAILHQLGTIGYVSVKNNDRQQIIDEQMQHFERISEKLSKLSPSFNLEHFQSHQHNYLDGFAKILRETAERLSIFDKYPEFAGVKEYTTLQTAQVRRFIEEQGVFHQVGWNMSNKVAEPTEENLAKMISKRQLTEQYFCQMLEFCYPELNFQSSFVQPDIDFETGNQKPPYTLLNTDARPSIDKRFSDFCAENSNTKCFPQAIQRLSNKLITPFEGLFGAINNKTNIEKIDIIQDALYGL